MDFFISKFKQLWKSGVGAHLDVDTHAGQAWIGLRVRRGHPTGPQIHYHREKPRDGPPSRQRRRARRAAARQKVLEESEAGKQAEDLTHLEEPIIDGEVVENDDQNDQNELKG